MAPKRPLLRAEDAYEDTGDQDAYLAYPYDDRRSQRWIMQERRAIRNGDRAWAKGQIVDRDADTYLLEYPHLPDHPGIEMPIPSTRRDGPWNPVQWPLLDPMEALIGPFRFGKVVRSIVAMLFTDGHDGGRVIEGHNVGDALEQILAQREDREPLHYGKEQAKTANRWKTVTNALNQLADYGYIWMFQNVDDESVTLLVATPLLLTELPDLFKRFRPDFFREDHLGVPELGQSSNPQEGLLAEWPYIAKVDPNPRRVVQHAGAHYENRATTRWELPVLPEDRAPRQEVHLVARGIPIGTEYQIQSSSVEQMSAIQHVSFLHDYIDAGTAVGLAIAELGSHIEATSTADVAQGLLLLTPEDQLAVYDYVVSHLNPVQLEELRLMQFKGTPPVDLIHAAVEMVPTKGKRRAHDLRQIRLLVAALCQDLIGLWSGQVVEARPRPALSAAHHPSNQIK
jgi:hypothetical protein